jgi:hypothetical protein
MKRISIILLFLLLGCTSAQINQTLGEVNKVIGGDKPVTTAEVADGLKEALVKGISNGSDIVSQVDGYFKNPQIKIPFPPDVKKVEDRLRQIGLGKEVDKFILTLNRGAEDAWGILRGNDDAATQYLIRTTSAQLKEKFKPVIQNSLQKVNATKYYNDIVTRYNSIPMVQKVNPDLDDYATDKAIEGLFLMIAKEEKNIRADPAARTTELLKRVFGSQAK